jgi:hypothetical protein
MLFILSSLLFWGNLGDRWGNLGARCGNIEAKIFQSLACLGKDFQVTSPPKIFACQFSGDTLLSSFFRNI